MALVTVVGNGGMLGGALVRAFAAAGFDATGLSRSEADITDAEAVAQALDRSADVVVNAAAWTDVDGCARDPQRALLVNGVGAGNVAAAADDIGALVVQVSTNEVFEGSPDTTYTELDTPHPINPYGASKLDGERRVALSRRHLIVRTAWLFDETRGFPARIQVAAARALAMGTDLEVVVDEWGNPTWVPAVAEAIVSATSLRLGDRLDSLIHLAGSPPASRADWARDVLGEPTSVRMVGIGQSEFHRASRVPPHAVLSTALAERLGFPPITWRGRITAPASRSR